MAHVSQGFHPGLVVDRALKLNSAQVTFGASTERSAFLYELVADHGARVGDAQVGGPDLLRRPALREAGDAGVGKASGFGWLGLEGGAAGVGTIVVG